MGTRGRRDDNVILYAEADRRYREHCKGRQYEDNPMQAITVWLDDDLYAALTRFVADTGNIVSPEEALRAAFRDWALIHGYIGRDDLDEEARPEDET